MSLHLQAVSPRVRDRGTCAGTVVPGLWCRDCGAGTVVPGPWCRDRGAVVPGGWLAQILASLSRQHVAPLSPCRVCPGHDAIPGAHHGHVGLAYVKHPADPTRQRP